MLRSSHSCCDQTVTCTALRTIQKNESFDANMQTERGANQIADVVHVYCQEVQTDSDGFSVKLDFYLMMERCITILGFLVVR